MALPAEGNRTLAGEGKETQPTAMAEAGATGVEPKFRQTSHKARYVLDSGVNKEIERCKKADCGHHLPLRHEGNNGLVICTARRGLTLRFDPS